MKTSSQPTKRKKKFSKTFEKMEGFSFVTPVTGLNRPNTGNDDDDDKFTLQLLSSVFLSFSFCKFWLHIYISTCIFICPSVFVFICYLFISFSFQHIIELQMFQVMTLITVFVN
jgi:hypothetical protein